MSPFSWKQVIMCFFFFLLQPDFFVFFLFGRSYIFVSRYLATASSDKTVKIWNLDGFKLEKVLTGIWSLRVSERGMCSLLHSHQYHLTGHERWVWDCDFSMDGEYLVTGTT